MSRGAIHKLITNPIYIGKIRHKDKLHDGQHEAIIALDRWERVQEKLEAASAKRRGHVQGHECTAWLKGKLFDDTGDRLTPTHTRKGGRIIRYYISNRLVKSKDPAGWRLPARQIEDAVCRAIISRIDGPDLSATIGATISIHQVQPVLEKLSRWCGRMKGDSQLAINTAHLILQRVDIQTGQIKLTLNRQALAETLDIDKSLVAPAITEFTSSFTTRRRGVETRIIVGETCPVPDRVLQKNLAKAHGWLERVKAGETISAIAKKEGTSASFVRNRLSFALLSPRIQKVILNGKQPVDLTADRLIKARLPLDW